MTPIKDGKLSLTKECLDHRMQLHLINLTISCRVLCNSSAPEHTFALVAMTDLAVAAGVGALAAVILGTQRIKRKLTRDGVAHRLKQRVKRLQRTDWPLYNELTRRQSWDTVQYELASITQHARTCNASWVQELEHVCFWIPFHDQNELAFRAMFGNYLNNIIFLLYRCTYTDQKTRDNARKGQDNAQSHLNQTLALIKSAAQRAEAEQKKQDLFKPPVKTVPMSDDQVRQHKQQAARKLDSLVRNNTRGAAKYSTSLPPPSYEEVVGRRYGAKSLSSPASIPKSDIWAIPLLVKLRYEAMFMEADANRDGYLDGSEAGVLYQSGLDNATLRRIWVLSDVDRDNKLSRVEFCLAIHLVSIVRTNVSLPQALPDGLKQWHRQHISG